MTRDGKGKVVSLRAESWAGQVDENVVQVAREVLERAESGEFRGLVVAGIKQDGTVTTRQSATDKYPELVGAATLLLHDLVTDPDG